MDVAVIFILGLCIHGRFNDRLDIGIKLLPNLVGEHTCLEMEVTTNKEAVAQL